MFLRQKLTETLATRRGIVIRRFSGTLLALSSILGVDSTVAQTLDSMGAAPSLMDSVVKATGEVEIVWPGGKGLEGVGGSGGEKLAFAAFEAFPADAAHPKPRGEFRYIVTNPDLAPHREIVAELFRVDVDVLSRKAWLIGQVIEDTRACGGGDSPDDIGCDGGCSGGEEDGHDSGCSSGGQESGGCAGEEGSTQDGGCSGTDAGGGTGSMDGGMGTSSGGGRVVSGRGTRVGQVVVVKVHDVATPGTNGDGITWKWFAPAATEEEFVAWLNRDLAANCPHLCKKTIIGGNLVVHPVPTD